MGFNISLLPFKYPATGKNFNTNVMERKCFPELFSDQKENCLYKNVKLKMFIAVVSLFLSFSFTLFSLFYSMFFSSCYVKHILYGLPIFDEGFIVFSIKRTTVYNT